MMLLPLQRALPRLALLLRHQTQRQRSTPVAAVARVAFVRPFATLAVGAKPALGALAEVLAVV